jgi:predicted nuclease of predicted toxin-antitoxin system
LHFLVDASLPRAVADVIRAAGHGATDVRDIGLGNADDSVIARHAKDHGFALISRDGDFGNNVDYPPHEYFGIVVIEAPEGSGRAVVLAMVEQFLKASDVIAKLPGRLAIVERHRIRLRPP